MSMLSTHALQAAALLGLYIEWDTMKVRRKLLPLLLTWDAEHPGHVSICKLWVCAVWKPAGFACTAYAAQPLTAATNILLQAVSDWSEYMHSRACELQDTHVSFCAIYTQCPLKYLQQKTKWQDASCCLNDQGHAQWQAASCRPKQSLNQCA